MAYAVVITSFPPTTCSDFLKILSLHTDILLLFIFHHILKYKMKHVASDMYMTFLLYLINFYLLLLKLYFLGIISDITSNL